MGKVFILMLTMLFFIGAASAKVTVYDQYGNKQNTSWRSSYGETNSYYYNNYGAYNEVAAQKSKVRIVKNKSMDKNQFSPMHQNSYQPSAEKSPKKFFQKKREQSGFEQPLPQ